jgi:hypothetical protein
MGLDMYAYVATRAGQQDEFYRTSKYIEDTNEWVSETAKPREIAYWRKHPNLHGWMQSLWIAKGYPGYDQADPSPMNDGPMFNGIELELTAEDLNALERAVVHGQLPSTQGFFFGDGADDYYRESDLEFIKNARAELFFGLKVFYNSSW